MSLMKRLRFTVYRHPWQRLDRETTQGTWLEPPAKRVVRIVVRYLPAAGRLHIPETRTDTVPPSSDFFANPHTCSRPATFRKFTSQQSRRIFRARHGFKFDRYDDQGFVVLGRVHPHIDRPCFQSVRRERDQDFFSGFAR